MNIQCTINSIFLSNTWSIYNEFSDCVWLVDAGDVDEIVGRIELEGKRIVGVLLTHVHFDHIYGLNRLLEHNPDLVVYVGADDKDALYSGKLNMSRYHEEGEFIFDGNNVKVVREGECVNLWDNVVAKVLKVPGHTPGCIAYQVGKYLFTGDAYIPGYEVVTSLPRANKVLAKESWERIDKILVEEGLKLCAGHGV